MGTISRKRVFFLSLALAFCAGCGQQRNERTAQRERIEILADLHRGNLTSAGQRARAGAKAWCGRPASSECARFRILDSEVLLASGRAREAYQAIEKLQPASAELQLERDIGLARALLRLDRHAEARKLAERVLRAADADSSPALYAHALNVKAQLMAQDGEGDGAEAAWQKALAAARTAGDPYDSSSILNNIGTYYLQTGEYDRATPYLQQALAGFRQAGSARLSSVALSNLAICLQQLGAVDRSLEMRKRAIAIQERTGASFDLQQSYGEAGRLHHAQGELQRAVSYYRRALDLALKLGSNSSAATWAINLASAYTELQDWPDAEKYNRQAEALSRSKRDDSGLFISLNSGEIAAGMGQKQQAEEDFNRVLASPGANPRLQWNAHDELASLYLASGDVARADQHFESAVSLIEETRAGLAHEEEKITFLFEPIRVYKDYVDALVSQGNSSKALLVADASRAQVLLNRLDSDRAGPPSGTIREFQNAAREADATLLEYWLGPRASYAWVITPRQVRMLRLPENETRIRKWVGDYRAEIERGSRDPLTNPASAGWKLYDALLRPLETQLPPGSRVILAPDGALHDLNFETLPVPGPTPCYWIEKAVVSVAPSLGVLTAQPGRLTAPPAGLLAVGDPEPVKDFPKLSYAGREIASLERRFPARKQTLLTGAQATPAAYLGAHPERFAYIHFTAHAEANGDKPLDSAVILSPAGGGYKLYARQIASAMPLNANLVTVSACRGAGAKTYSGEGLVGFAWAFLHAGARHVIAGLWDVDDNATARLMDRLYAGIERGEAPDRALREAKLNLLRSPGNIRKPYYWGPFQLYRRSPR